MAPVENERSSLARKQTSAATSSAVPDPAERDALDHVVDVVWESPSRIGVSITAGATQLTSTPVPATSLPIAFVIAITAALLAE